MKRAQDVLLLFLLIAIVLASVVPQIHLPMGVFYDNVRNPIWLRCRAASVCVTAAGLITAASPGSLIAEGPQGFTIKNVCNRHSLLDLICVLLC